MGYLDGSFWSYRIAVHHNNLLRLDSAGFYYIYNRAKYVL